MAIQRIAVYSLEEAEALVSDARTAVISVTDPDREAWLNPGFASVLRLAFHDVGDNPSSFPGCLGGIQPFERAHARALIAWAQGLAEKPEGYHVIVHCHAGVSRSPAIGWFLHQRYGAEMPWLPHFCPNPRVLRLLAECSGMVNLVAPPDSRSG